MDLVTSFVLSVELGNLLAVMASGITLTYSVMRFTNFAHGEFISVGAYISYFSYYLFQGLPSFVSIVPAFAGGAVVAIALNYIMFRPLTRRKATLTALLVGSIGVSFAFKYTLYILTDLQGVWTFLPGGRLSVPAVGGPQPATVTYFLSVPISDYFIFSLITAVAIVAFLSYFLFYTTPGRFSRALADNPELAETIGIPTERIKLITWVLIGGFSAIGGALLSPSYIFGTLTPEMGLTVLFYVFAASILGGRTDFYATLVSSYIVAFASTYGIALASAYFGIPAALQPVVPFGIMVATLLLRPGGIGGMKIGWLRRGHSRMDVS